MYRKNFSLHVIDTGVAEAEENMAFDARLLSELQSDGNPVLHLYDWSKPAATYGHFIDLKKHLELEKASFRRLSLARRPTGGGIVFHIWDLAFSFLMPAAHPACSLNTLENYRFVNEVVIDVVQEAFPLPQTPILAPEHAPAMGPHCENFCMAKPTIYDVVSQGRKIAGAAQRRTKRGYLHQGTISLGFPDLALLRDVLLSKEELIRAMELYSFAPLGRVFGAADLRKTRLDLQERLKQKFLAKLELFAL